MGLSVGNRGRFRIACNREHAQKDAQFIRKYKHSILAMYKNRDGQRTVPKCRGQILTDVVNFTIFFLI